MVSALYYPHTQIRNTSLLKSALLLWDSIEYIVPRTPWRNPPYSDKNYTRALEIIGRPRVPSGAEKKMAHENIKVFVENGLPKSFYLMEGRDQRYLIYPDKFEYHTWRLLTRSELAYWVDRDSDYGVSPALGLLLMSLLADACAGTQLLKVTDRSEAYAWLAENLTQKLGGQYAVGLDPSQIAPTYDRLVTLSVHVLDAEKISIKRLLSMREREARKGGNYLRAFRRRYLEAVNSYVDRLRTQVKTRNDVAEVERQFQIAMKDDLADLKIELGLAKKKALLSKEVGVTAVAVAGSLIEPISGITSLATTVDLLGVGALVKTGVEYRAARRKALRDHPMSWLYLTRKRF